MGKKRGPYRPKPNTGPDRRKWRPTYIPGPEIGIAMLRAMGKDSLSAQAFIHNAVREHLAANYPDIYLEISKGG